MHIIGAGGHAKVVIDSLKESGINIEGIWDDNLLALLPYGHTPQGRISDFCVSKFDGAIIAIGDNWIRKKISNLLSMKTFDNIIHLTSYISASVIVGHGIAVMANASITSSVSIGNHVIINTNSSVDHDCVLEDFVHISPGAAISGGVIVGQGAHIGVGACVIPGIRIGQWAQVGAGSVIIKDVPDYAVVVGNPGMIKKYNK